MSLPACAPADLPVSLHPAVRIGASGRLLAGGSPRRLISLTPSGARVVARWRGRGAPAPVGGRSGERRLARRLLDAGILTPHPAPVPSTAELIVIVPVRDRAAQLDRCLDAVARGCPGSPIAVVDDGSRDPAPLQAICAARGAQLIRHERSQGPGAARNAALAVCTTPFVAFVDSDVVLPGDAAHRLLGHLGDPSVGAVAPRVRGLPPVRGLIGAYEGRHSALDMGPDGGLVGPGRPVSYVPSAVLFARRGALGDGFDAALRVGEDVDLVWRLCRAGWRVRYAPEVDIWHDHRLRLRDFTADRRRYARSLGPLSRRHPGAAPAMRISPGLALPWALALAGRPRGAAAAVAWAILRYRARLSQGAGGLVGVGGAASLAGAGVARGLAATGQGLGYAVRRAWAPALLAVAWRRPRARAILAAAYAAPVIEDALATRDLRALPADAGLRLLGELVALAGTWEGCVRSRTLGPLLPTRGGDR
ncbi:MAG TPA: mycofactocin biosynthesis glycosyltransferase MftF [Solirubrobacteraceae bacterium]|jgi:mycofactocin system glycosyltransferase|nr:mycofactocin biosynthesis glycosyltransferase MftF [Solirubrobacteraceae bacterium]